MRLLVNRCHADAPLDAAQKRDDDRRVRDNALRGELAPFGR